MGLVNTPFDIPNVRCENGKALAHTRVGWYRSVSNIPRVFAVQSAVCEAAHKLGTDPKDFLLELIGPDRQLDPKALGIPGGLLELRGSLRGVPDRHGAPQECRAGRGREGGLGQEAARASRSWHCRSQGVAELCRHRRACGR